MVSTSISDFESYRKTCADAAASDTDFDRFRTNEVYRYILEHTSLEQAAGYITCVAQQSPHLFDYLDHFRANDKFGGAEIFNFQEPIGPFATSTWRYIKVVSDLSMMFGDCRNFRIVEIGGGYGGQCAAISYLFPFIEYIIFDLPEPLSLQRKFLGRLGIKNVAFLTEESLPEVLDCDLVISNYALSELVKPLAHRYIDCCVSHAKRAYLTCNQIAADTLSKDEFMTRLPLAVATAEMPLTHRDNYILSWRRPSASYSADPYRRVASVYQAAAAEAAR